MDIIFLTEDSVETHLGVPEWERMAPQTVILDIEFAMPGSRSCETDDIADTIDYGLVVKRIRQTLSERSFKLVEALAEHVSRLILDEFAVTWIKVRVSKPGILPGVKRLGVAIERARQA